MRPPRGTTLLVSLLVVYLIVLSGREVFREKSLPAVSVEKDRKISVMLKNGFPLEGIHQFYDEIDLVTVIRLTIPPNGPLRLSREVPQAKMMDGSSLALIVEDGEIVDFSMGWMPATQRMALGIKLHPDRMTQEDWEALPGIGVRLAAVIEEDRHKNGDFISIEGLDRVPGIGTKSIERWKCFF
ncbi:MAG: hypothetical protein A2X84_07445 [Desulfuromonadaceae bacterium GWC2_58_13]|nr:MAG: hypothetical protein A2X84_07445 [Desulfuromonadaceae bacterium GWC2_58_13]